MKRRKGQPLDLRLSEPSFSRQSRSVQVPPLLSSDTLPEGRCAVSKDTVTFWHDVLSTRPLTGP
jgi:hypothetical protein